MIRTILGSPCRIGSLEVKNRIVMESMGNTMSELDGKVGAMETAFYEARAKGGVGLIMGEAASVDSVTGRANPRNMCLDDDSQIEPLKKMMEVLHGYGCAFFAELYHPGRQGVSAFNGNRSMFTPSGIECQCVHQPVKAMTVDDIEYVREKFIQAAVRCRKADVDGVLIHGAHGYLITQFLSPYTNKRTDKYGGNPENRARLLLEIVEGIRRECGPDYPIGVRLSASEYLDYNGLNPEEGITLELTKEYVRMIEQAGADLIDVSSGIYETMNTAWEPVGFEQGWKIENAREIRKITNLPVVCTSVIRDPDYAEQLLQDGVCDFVGSARTHLADPEWANKSLENRELEIRKCISCLNCMKELMNSPRMKCAVNAQACHELERADIRRNGSRRGIAVIGGGPAGMEAARVLALRDFKVTLFEKQNNLGGIFCDAAKPPFKEKLQRFNEYLEHQIRSLGVDIRLGHTPSREEIEELEPYAVFVAAGTDPVVPESIPGVHRENVYSVFDVLRGRVDLSGKKVCLVGGGMTGLETTEFLAANGSEVEVYEMLEELAAGEHFQNIIDIEHRIGNIPQYTGHRLLEINDTGCCFEVLKEGCRKQVDCDAVVLSLGMKPSKCAETEYKDLPNLRVVGSNKKFGAVAICVEDAFVEAYNLEVD